MAERHAPHGNKKFVLIQQHVPRHLEQGWCPSAVLSETEITELMNDRTFDDDPRAEKKQTRVSWPLPWSLRSGTI